MDVRCVGYCSGSHPFKAACCRKGLRCCIGSVLAASPCHGRSARADLQAPIRTKRAQHVWIPLFYRSQRVPLLSTIYFAEPSYLVSPERLLGLSTLEPRACDSGLTRWPPLVPSGRSRRARRSQIRRTAFGVDDQKHRHHRHVPQWLRPGCRFAGALGFVLQGSARGNR